MDITSFSADVTHGTTAPNALIDVKIDNDGAITIIPNSADQVGDHDVSIYLLDNTGKNVKVVITFTVEVTSV